MKKSQSIKGLIAVLTAVVLACLMWGSITTMAAEKVSYTVSVYSVGTDGLPLKVKPDINAARYTRIPAGTSLLIDQIEDGWGHTTYNGKNGWVALRYTRITSRYQAKEPEQGWYVEMANYLVHDTEGEGLELRVEPNVHCSTFGPVPDGTILTVLAIHDDWAYTSYKGNYGWTNLTYMSKTDEKPVSAEVQVKVYDTDGEGLSLKKEAGLSAERILTVPEDAILVLDEMTEEGWGHTDYNGNSGWVSLRYTRILGEYEAEKPETILSRSVLYTVYNTEGEGLELRTRPDVESATFGPVPEGSILQITAFHEDWAYTQYNGHNGWVNLTYLKKTAN